MRLLLVAVVSLAGCVDRPIDSGERGLAEEAPTLHNDVLGTSPGTSSCSVTTELSALSTQSLEGMCGLAVTVHVNCDASRQLYKWIRVGVIVDGELFDHIDTGYACDRDVAQTFSVPCDAVSIVGGATLDHPETGEDVSCESAAQ
jgi:hypothetical protein